MPRAHFALYNKTLIVGYYKGQTGPLAYIELRFEIFYCTCHLGYMDFETFYSTLYRQSTVPYRYMYRYSTVLYNGFVTVPDNISITHSSHRNMGKVSV